MLPSFFKKEARAISFLGRVLHVKLSVWELPSLCSLPALNCSCPTVGTECKENILVKGLYLT